MVHVIRQFKCLFQNPIIQIFIIIVIQSVKVDRTP